ncbi:hypothetical protein BH23ACT3_BH23ACT3_08610 [soil metagenome]
MPAPSALDDYEFDLRGYLVLRGALSADELHNVLDCGDPAFETLIDHPDWIGHVRRYAGEQETHVEGITIDENIATIRCAGAEGIPTDLGYSRSAIRG